MGGTETYAQALTEQLALSSAVRAEAFLPASARGFSRGIPERLVQRLNGGPGTRQRLLQMAKITARSGDLRRKMAEADVVHYPFTVALPAPSSGQAAVQTLHDVQHLDLPHLFSKSELIYRHKFYEGFAKRADAVITISHFAKQRMVDRLGLDPARIFVAHLGVDTDRYVPNLGPRENFVLYPARGWPHKNHARLVTAVEIARKTVPGLRLVLTGGGLDQLGDLPDWVDRKGFVDQSELQDLYRAAAALIFPSLYEGFGLPPLEAMASGCPVAVSREGSLPEIVGRAAVQFDPHEPAAIAGAIIEAIRRTDELQAAGVLRAKEFTWESCREAHVQAYSAAVQNRR
nr:glycosyltransferase family 1 protein [Cryobacterium sp. TMT2-15-1]